MNSKTTTLGNENRLLGLFQKGELRVTRYWRIERRGDGEWRPAEYSKGDKRGHRMTRVYLAGECVRVSSHRLIYRLFVGAIPDGHVVDHVDGDKQNNAPSNLRAVTPQRNTRLAMESGAMRVHGLANPRGRLDELDVQIVREVMASTLYSAVQVGSAFRLCPSYVARLARGERR